MNTDEKVKDLIKSCCNTPNLRLLMNAIWGEVLVLRKRVEDLQNTKQCPECPVAKIEAKKNGPAKGGTRDTKSVSA